MRESTAAQERNPPRKLAKLVLAVGSGKGGVGKSSVSVLLAKAAARSGLRVGLLDADITGPSIPMLLGAPQAKPGVKGEGDDRHFVPPQVDGVLFHSMALLLQSGNAATWRGPMVSGALLQILNRTEWGPLDVLIVDLPPGTSDTLITAAKSAFLDGLLLVTTPDPVAVQDGVRMGVSAGKTGVTLIGAIENMAWVNCSHCSERHRLWGQGGGADLAKKLEIPLLDSLPWQREWLSEKGAGDESAFGDQAQRLWERVRVRATMAGADKVRLVGSPS